MADEKLKYNNIREALKDGKTRTIYVVGVVLVIAIGIFAFFSMKKSVPRGEFPSAEVAAAPSIKNSAPSVDKTTPAYDKLIKAENQQEAAKAKEEGGSALPVMRAPVEQKPVEQTSAQQQPAYPPAPQESASHREDERKREQAIKDRAAAMKSQVNLLIAAWTPKVHVNMPVGGKEKNDAKIAAGVPSQGVGSVATTGGATRNPSKKAGETCYAELDTFVNTDEPSPVFATIKQCGELDQSILIGKVEVPQSAYAQKAELRFTTINVPGQPNSLPVEAVAINEETRRTALATDVDNHYFLRYGGLFASSFLSGYADALLKGGQNQSIVTTQSGAIVQNTAYTNRQLMQAGLGNVGKQASTAMGGVFNRPPTITIDDKENPGAHIGIGIVFMKDLTLK